MQSAQPDMLRRFFAGLAEFTFQTRLGVADPPLVDYVSDLLTRFVRQEVLFRIRDLRGRPLLEVAEMLAEAEQRIGDARREVHRHIGDFTLFWVGVYPESLRGRQGPMHRDHLIDYQAEGKRSYWIASTIETDTEKEKHAPAEVLERLSRDFELCAYGLGEVRREWERRDDDDVPQPFLIN
jgi:hypothetical protein